MGSGISTKIALGISLVAVYCLTFMVMPIWIGIWVNILLLDLIYLGYVFLGISLLGILGIIFSNARKHPSRRNFFLVMSIFTMIIALDIIFNAWYATIWFGSILIPHKKQESMAVIFPEAIPA